jgi:APA family basic amino acid/polyamine antiporter
MLEDRRDAGLLRTVGTWGFAASTINAVIGASIFVVPATLAASLGYFAPIAVLACAIAIGSIAICFAEGGSRVPTSGGAYGYIEAAFGPMAGYVSGTALWFSNLLASSGIAAALADTVITVLPPRWAAPAHAAIIILVIAAIAGVNLTGATRGAQLINAATLLKLIPLAVFLLAGVSAFHGTKFLQGVTPTTTGIGPAVILALFAFTGMEVSVCASGEVTEPSRTIPRALLIAMLVLTLLYVSIQVIAQGMLGSALAHSAVPLADAMAPISPVLRLMMLAGAAFSMFGFISTDLLCSPRILLALARDGLLPPILGKVNSGTHTPNAAILCHAALAITLSLSGSFVELAVLSTLVCALLYIAGCAAALRLARRGVALAGNPLNFRWLPAAAFLGIASMLGLIALASRREILGMVGLVALSALIYLVQTRAARSTVRPSAK